MASLSARRIFSNRHFTPPKAHSRTAVLLLYLYLVFIRRYLYFDLIWFARKTGERELEMNCNEISEFPRRWNTNCQTFGHVFIVRDRRNFPIDQGLSKNGVGSVREPAVVPNCVQAGTDGTGEYCRQHGLPQGQGRLVLSYSREVEANCMPSSTPVFCYSVTVIWYALALLDSITALVTMHHFQEHWGLRLFLGIVH